ncbi:MAG: tripartite tricarboxylate transporter substrate-binding protein [Pseudomonadota bacterium]
MKGATMFSSRLLALALVFSAGATLAQSYPNKAVRVIVPFPAGGSTDIVGRTVAQKLSELWGQPVVVDNRAGGGTVIGTDIVAKAPASREQGSRLRDANVREQGESAVG